jgi:hypothetical protein
LAEVVKELLVRGASIDRDEDGTAGRRSDGDLSLAAAVVDTNDNGSVQWTEILRPMLFATVGAVAAAHVVHNLYNDHVRHQDADDKTRLRVKDFDSVIETNTQALATVKNALDSDCTDQRANSLIAQEYGFNMTIAKVEVKKILFEDVVPDPTVQSGPRMVLMGWCAAVLVVVAVVVAVVHLDLSGSRSAVDTWTAVADDVGGNGDGELNLSDVVSLVSLGLLVAATAEAVSKK